MLMKCFIFGMFTFLITGAQCQVTEVFAEAGSTAVLPCKSEHPSSAEPTIVWSKANKGTVWRKQRNGLEYCGSSWVVNGTKRVQCPHPQFDRGEYNLHVKDVREDDGGVYICRIENQDQVVMLRVIAVSFSPAVPLLLDTFSVNCDVTPWPNGASVRWILNDSAFVPRTGVISNGDTSERIVKERATEQLIGKWTCVVGHRGKMVQASAALSLRGIVQPSSDNTKLYAAVGSLVTLPCVLSHDLAPLRADWEKMEPGSLFDALPLPSYSYSPLTSKHSWDRSINLRQVAFKDEGKYRCHVVVEDRWLKRYMQLVVAKIDTSVSSKKKDSITLSCQLSDTSEVTNYEWVHVTYDINGTQSVVSIHKGKTLTISQVSEDNWGEWTCRFSNKDGILGNVTYHGQMMSGLRGQKSAGIQQNTGTIIGLSVLLLVLLLVLAQMYKNHQRRKRIFQYPALETIVHTISNEREQRERCQVKM